MTIRNGQPDVQSLIDRAKSLLEKRSNTRVIPKGFEVLELRGKIIVDGNHLFLETVKQMLFFNERFHSIQKFWSPKKEYHVDNIFENLTPDHVSRIAEFYLASHAAPWCHIDASMPYCPPGKSPIPVSWVNERRDASPTRHVVVESFQKIVVVECYLRDREERIREINDNLRRSSSQAEAIKLRAELQDVRAELYRHPHISEKLPYDLKNNYIDNLRESDFFDVQLGTRNQYGGEKQADVLFTLAGCEAGIDSKLDWICLITNDSDFIPLINYLEKSGKLVLWLPLCDPKKASNALYETGVRCAPRTPNQVLIDALGHDEKLLKEILSTCPIAVDLYFQCMLEQMLGSEM